MNSERERKGGRRVRVRAAQKSTPVYRSPLTVYASAPMDHPTTRTCPACGAPASGNFCNSCGANLAQRSCAHCRAELSAQARFCHRCGTPVGLRAPGAAARSERKAWIAAAGLCVLLVAAIVYQVSTATSAPAAPDMANAGSSSGLPGDPGSAGRAPDISNMTPQERFDRLFNRIMEAAGRQDSAEVERFTPMALGAYQQLESRNADSRYHAAVLYLQVGNLAAAQALADTIQSQSPAHLFGYVVRGEVAKLRGDSAQLRRAQRDFLAHYQAEKAAGRVEYLEHEPVVEGFKAEAEKRER